MEVYKPMPSTFHRPESSGVCSVIATTSQKEKFIHESIMEYLRPVYQV